MCGYALLICDRYQEISRLSRSDLEHSRCHDALIELRAELKLRDLT